MEVPEKIVNVVLIHTGTPVPLHSTTSQHLSDALLAEHPGISFSQVHISDDSQVSTLIESMQAGSPASIIEQVHSNLSDNTADNRSYPLIIVSHMNPATEESDIACEQSLLEKTAATAELAKIPVIAVLIGNPQVNPSLTSNSNQGKSATIKPGESGKRKFHTINIRDDYRLHDIALAAGQCFSLLNITLAEDSALTTYPVTPEKPGGCIALDSLTLMQSVASDTPDWELQTLVDDTTSRQGTSEITRNLRFSSFQSAIRYMHQVAPACDIANHHPRWENNWRDLRIWLTTWDADQQITDRDLQLARYFDYVYTRYGYAEL